ncbi:hypothetical protein I4F81_011931 [Pyropia yezoensis]|uniref:Uncharacterized protein n=1 Tax=Pyropia yezoensis TaxID=2788 RepID=A0ACC3CH88_PYRYE|nr:hypothetical protein I4F81_011931 [Neopyropia yezoensis]
MPTGPPEWWSGRYPVGLCVLVKVGPPSSDTWTRGNIPWAETKAMRPYRDNLPKHQIFVRIPQRGVQLFWCWNVLRMHNRVKQPRYRRMPAQRPREPRMTAENYERREVANTDSDASTDSIDSESSTECAHHHSDGVDSDDSSDVVAGPIIRQGKMSPAVAGSAAATDRGADGGAVRGGAVASGGRASGGRAGGGAAGGVVGGGAVASAGVNDGAAAGAVSEWAVASGGGAADGVDGGGAAGGVDGGGAAESGCDAAGGVVSGRAMASCGGAADGADGSGLAEAGHGAARSDDDDGGGAAAPSGGAAGGVHGGAARAGGGMTESVRAGGSRKRHAEKRPGGLSVRQVFARRPTSGGGQAGNRHGSYSTREVYARRGGIASSGSRPVLRDEAGPDLGAPGVFGDGIGVDEAARLHPVSRGRVKGTRSLYYEPLAPYVGTYGVGGSGADDSNDGAEQTGAGPSSGRWAGSRGHPTGHLGDRRSMNDGH